MTTDSESASLNGTVAIVTGAGRGIGQAVAVALASRGAVVLTCARTESQLEETAEAITSRGGQVVTRALDVTDRGAVMEMALAGEQLGPVQTLVNNAGICDALGLFWEVSLDAWHRDIEVNLLGSVNCAHAVLPAMIRRGKGRIINVISGAAFNPHELWSAYCTSKAAQNAFTENLATETTPRGVQVFSLAPGLVHTALLDRAVSTGIPSVVEQFGSALETGRNIPVEQPAEFVARIAIGEVDALSGRTFDANEMFDDVVSKAEEIVANGLYKARPPAR